MTLSHLAVLSGALLLAGAATAQTSSASSPADSAAAAPTASASAAPDTGSKSASATAATAVKHRHLDKRRLPDNTTGVQPPPKETAKPQ